MADFKQWSSILSTNVAVILKVLKKPNPFTISQKKQKILLPYTERTGKTTYSFLAEKFGIKAEPVVCNIEEALQENVTHICTVICCKQRCHAY